MLLKRIKKYWALGFSHLVKFYVSFFVGQTEFKIPVRFALYSRVYSMLINANQP